MARKESQSGRITIDNEPTDNSMTRTPDEGSQSASSSILHRKTSHISRQGGDGIVGMNRSETASDYRRRLQEEAGDLEAFSIHESLPEGFQPSYSTETARDLEQEESAERSKQTFSGERWLLLYKQLSILTLGGLLGVLARRGLTSLSSYNGSYISGVVWSNFTACVVMGLALESKKIWMNEGFLTKYPSKPQVPLYVGITTGLCGSLSSFSSMILEMFEKATDLEPDSYSNYTNPAYGIMEFLSVIIAQISMSMAGLFFGKHMGRALDRSGYSITIPHYRIAEAICVLLGTFGWIATIVIAASVHHGRAWALSCVFAPLGVFARFYLSKLLNPMIKDFPLGTFACNLLGSTLLAIFNLLNRGKLNSGSGKLVSSIIGCEVLEGLSDGFCGCFTTVSTFAVELNGLRTEKAYKYGAVSVLISFIVLLLIMGPYNWAVGFAPPVC